MIDEGITGSDGVASFAIRLTKPLDLPQAELPIDPYLLGAFLGGGSSTDGTITVGAEDLAEFLANLEPIWPHHSVAKGGAAFRIALHKDPHSCGRGHRDDFVRKSNGNRACLACNREGNAARRAGATRTVRVNVPFSTLLGDAGLLKTKKHIPAEYMRASAAQRLALLQGLMDTDGTISKRGSCELALCNEDLALGALELIRSLGIKASMTSGPAAITEADPERAGENRRRVVGTRWRIKFTTNRPVFRLPRKAARLKPTISSQSSMLYVQAIAPAPTEPGRCIQVDSPDSSYLTGDGYVPTQNTVILTSLTSFLSPAFAYERKVMAVADGTANAIDMAMNGLDNCFLLVDDWHPEVDPRERFKQAKALDQTLRRVHGAPSKARAMVDRQVDGVTLAPVNNSHPVLLLSTEKMPARQDAESMLDRMLTLNLAAESTFRKGDARRITHHGQSGLMQVANAGYLMWLAAKINGLSDDPVDAMQMWQKEVDDRRKEIAVAMGNQSRSSTARGTEVAAGMQAGVEMWLGYAASVGAVTYEQADEINNRTIELLLSACIEHTEQAMGGNTSETTLVIRALKSAIAAGELVISGVPTGGQRRLGQITTIQGTKCVAILGDRSVAGLDKAVLEAALRPVALTTTEGERVRFTHHVSFPNPAATPPRSRRRTHRRRADRTALAPRQRRRPVAAAVARYHRAIDLMSFEEAAAPADL